MVVLLPSCSVRTENAAVIRIAPVQGTLSQSLQARRIWVARTFGHAGNCVIFQQRIREIPVVVLVEIYAVFALVIVTTACCGHNTNEWARTRDRGGYDARP